MARGDVFVNDETTYRDTIKDQGGRTVDLSSEQVIELPTYVFTKPDGTVLTRDSSTTTDGSDGRVEYTMAETEQDQPGVWLRQVIVVFGNGTFSSDVRSQLVQEKLGN